MRPLTHVQHGTSDAGKSYPSAIAHAKEGHRTPNRYGCNRSKSCTLYAYKQTRVSRRSTKTKPSPYVSHPPGRSPEQRILRLRQVRHLQRSHELRVSIGVRHSTSEISKKPQVIYSRCAHPTPFGLRLPVSRHKTDLSRSRRERRRRNAGGGAAAAAVLLGRRVAHCERDINRSPRTLGFEDLELQKLNVTGTYP